MKKKTTEVIDSLQVPVKVLVDINHVDIRLHDVLSCNAISPHTVHDSRFTGNKVIKVQKGSVVRETNPAVSKEILFKLIEKPSELCGQKIHNFKEYDPIDTCVVESECFSPSDPSINSLCTAVKPSCHGLSRMDEKNNGFWSTKTGESKYEFLLNSWNPCVELYTTIQGKIKIKSTSKDLFGYMPLYYDKVLYQGVPKLLNTVGLEWLLQARSIIKHTG